MARPRIARGVRNASTNPRLTVGQAVFLKRAQETGHRTTCGQMGRGVCLAESGQENHRKERRLGEVGHERRLGAVWRLIEGGEGGSDEVGARGRSRADDGFRVSEKWVEQTSEREEGRRCVPSWQTAPSLVGVQQQSV